MVYLAGTTTPADVYATLDAAVAANGVASDEAGRYTFYVDTFDYGFDQTFKIICTRGTATVTVDNITIEDIVLGAYAVTANRTVTTNIHVPKGVTYTVATGVTLTFSGSFSAGLYQVFTGEGARSLWLGSGQGSSGGMVRHRGGSRSKGQDRHSEYDMADRIRTGNNILWNRGRTGCGNGTGRIPLFTVRAIRRMRYGKMGTRRPWKQDCY